MKITITVSTKDAEAQEAPFHLAEKVLEDSHWALQEARGKGLEKFERNLLDSNGNKIGTIKFGAK